MKFNPNKWGIIYNPMAGSGEGKGRWHEIQEYLDSCDIKYDYFQSEGYGAVERLADILMNNGYKTLIIVGGDGALNELINGILLSKPVQNDPNYLEQIRFGIIPNGLANDFAKFWDLSTDYKTAIQGLLSGRTRKVDIGQTRHYNTTKGQHIYRYFINAVNIGVGERMVRVTDRAKRFWGWKYMALLEAGFMLLFEKKQHKMHLRIDDVHIKGRYMTVCIGNCTGWGQTPSAVPYNSWLDISLIHRPKGIGHFIYCLWQMINNRIQNLKEVDVFRGKDIRVMRARNASIDLDSRLLGRCYPLDIKILPEKITMMIP
ncbi:MAG TPA: diacylglycerol kinase family protein [Bacteroidaceae bacterium]|nr:diacylglycerol kinase family protein [Bacteroidaceae bacterium]